MGTNRPSALVNMINEYRKNFNTLIGFGYKFRPLEKELFSYYLEKKILGLEPPVNMIEEIDVYSYNPDELPMDKFGHWMKNEAYFYTHRFSESLIESNNLTEGYWKALGGDVMILDRRKVVGFRRMVVFCWKEELIGRKIHWFIHEYRVNPSTFSACNDDKDLIAKVEHYVLCRVQSKAVEADTIPKLQDYEMDEHDWDESESEPEPDSDSEEEMQFTRDRSVDLVTTTEDEEGIEYKPAMAFQDAVASEELFPKFFEQHSSSP